uniref:Acetylcholine receptor subunit alpha-type unc-63 n=1 Tax=Elaeophora elaphi TaxID=1147741 RepID=A0A0R3S1N5_9BILA
MNGWMIFRQISCWAVSVVWLLPGGGQCGQDAGRLMEDLLADYNKLIRPVENDTDTLIVRLKLKLSQLLDVHEKNQIMTTNIWLQHFFCFSSWTDYKLKWNPADYGGVTVLYVPSDMIWLPDVVLYNNADGNYQVSIMTKAKLSPNGTVEWSPPAIYKSMCQIEVEWFPFDVQTCEMKFGSWTYGGLEVDLQHRDSHIERTETETLLGFDGEYDETVWIVDEGIDLSDYYPSVEWDILGVPGKRHLKRYPCCESPFIDLTYEIRLRRKTLFYIVYLIFPIVSINFLTVLVFYLPSDGGEKISLCLNILISLTIFFLLLVEIIPSTSLVIPLIGKYLLFTMVLVTLSVIVTVITLNVHFRSPSTHIMPEWTKRIFIDILPKYLLMRRPSRMKIIRNSPTNTFITSKRPDKGLSNLNRSRDHTISALFDQMDFLSPAYRSSFCTMRSHDGSSFASFQKELTPVMSAVDSVAFIASQMKDDKSGQQLVEDWKYISVVMDRLFLILFTTACMIGSVVIILRAPTIYDTTVALA